MVKSTKIGLNKVDGPMCLLYNDVTRPFFILTDPTKIFTYASEQRLQCTSCDRVRYRIDTPDILSVAIPVQEKGKDNDGKPVYESVRLSECIDGILGKEALEYSCPNCKKIVIAAKWVLLHCLSFYACSVMTFRQTRFASLPSVLVVHAKKFQLVNWVPTKLGWPFLVVRFPRPNANLCSRYSCYP